MSVIRSTFNGRLAALQSGTARNASRLGKAQEVATTGLKVQRPSDDPARSGRLYAIDEQLADQTVWRDNAEWAEGLLVAADEALTDIVDALGQARVLAVQLSNDSYGPSDRTNAVVSAQRLLERALASANTSFAGRSIFAGEAWDGPAYDATGAYLGDTGAPEIPVGEGLAVRSGFDGSDLLQGGGDVVVAFSNLVANLATGDADIVRSSLDDIDGAIAQLAEARTIVGNEMLNAGDAIELSESLELSFSDAARNIREADLPTAYTNLFAAQQAYQASLQVTAQSRSSLLFNLL
jgi:flagellar hook-associated protein 3 FlgL